MPGNKQLLDANKLFLSIPFSFASGAAVNSFSASRGLLLLLLLSRFSHVQLCATPETAAHQAPPSLGFSKQEHWSGLPFPSPVHESEKWKWSRSVGSGLFTTPWTAAYQAPPSMGFSRQEYWSRVPLPSPSLEISGDFCHSSLSLATCYQRSNAVLITHCLLVGELSLCPVFKLGPSLPVELAQKWGWEPWGRGVGRTFFPSLTSLMYQLSIFHSYFWKDIPLQCLLNCIF